MKKIFVDMDGVLTDFNKKYKEMFGATPSEIKSGENRTHYSEYWNQFVDRLGFEKLDWHPGAQELVHFLEKLENVQLCILTSAGGFDRQQEVMDQKLNWLDDRMIDWPAVVVPGRRYKAGFATGDSFMIDDTPDVIKGFCENGGSGIIHKDTAYTIEVLTRWLSPVPVV